jgi:hypothetical protein
MEGENNVSEAKERNVCRTFLFCLFKTEAAPQINQMKSKKLKIEEYLVLVVVVPLAFYP